MYRPPYTRADDPAVAYEIADAHPFATLVSTGADGDPQVSHVPLLRDGDTLVGHLARANPHLHVLGGRALAIFHGPHAYVSPTWYRTPGTNVPTWNYVTAHFTGRVELLDEEASAQALDTLVQRFEAEWTTDAAVRARLVNAIVGFRIVVDRVEAKLKLSQNREHEDAARVAEALRRAEPALSTWMRRVMESPPEEG
ncbi:transcriptional regulator [Deltaproteobacteria bacterium]|nr:transcriptional regulator [Deltaproteobacteria bacterium]